MFGYAILNDYHNAEWGYISLSELNAINIDGLEVDRDLYWEVRLAGLVKLIVESGGVNIDN